MVFNCVLESGDNDVPMVCIPAGSVGIPHDLVDAETLGTAILNARDYDESHIGAVVRRMPDEAGEDLYSRLTGKPAGKTGNWATCLVGYYPQIGKWKAICEAPSLRWTNDVDRRIRVGILECPCGAGAEELGGMVLESYARVDAWCARNGRNPYTGMPCPLREDLGADGVLVLTPPAYFQEDYAPAPGVVRGYYHHVDAMALPQEPGSRWYGGWVRGLDAWLCWRVVPAGGVDGLLGVWQAAHGRAVEVSSVGCEGEPGVGCFSSRGVVSNRSWASYWFRRELASGSVLELVLDVKQPGRRKRLAGKAVKAWERCARHTQLLPPDDAAGTQA
ncbi:MULTISPECIES: hypothetical protein [Bifidobacterium]|uniref:hypothetical protein n=1 Tax=Bifidobacterium TaxID=1678 RepID=UPI003F93A5F4